jgi:hypothetical protein
VRRSARKIFAVEINFKCAPGCVQNEPTIPTNLDVLSELCHNLD